MKVDPPFDLLVYSIRLLLLQHPNLIDWIMDHFSFIFRQMSKKNFVEDSIGYVFGLIGVELELIIECIWLI